MVVAAVVDRKRAEVPDQRGGSALRAGPDHGLAVEIKDDVLARGNRQRIAVHVDRLVRDHRDRRLGAVLRNGGDGFGERLVALAVDFGDVDLRLNLVEAGLAVRDELVVRRYAVGVRVGEAGRIGNRFAAHDHRGGDDGADRGGGGIDDDVAVERAAGEGDGHRGGVAGLGIDDGHGDGPRKGAATERDFDRLARAMLRHRDGRTLDGAAAAVGLVAVGVRGGFDRAAVHRERARANLDARVAAHGGALVHRHVRVAVERDADVHVVARTRRRRDRAVHDDVDLVLGVGQVAEHEQRAVHRAVHGHVDQVLLRVVAAEHVQAVFAAVENDVLSNGQSSLFREVARAADFDRGETGVRGRDRGRGGARVRDVQAAARQRDVARARDVVSIQVERDGLVLARRRVAVAAARVRGRRTRVHEQAVRQRHVGEQADGLAILGRGECLGEGRVGALDRFGAVLGNRNHRGCGGDARVVVGFVGDGSRDGDRGRPSAGVDLAVLDILRGSGGRRGRRLAVFDRLGLHRAGMVGPRDFVGVQRLGEGGRIGRAAGDDGRKGDARGIRGSACGPAGERVGELRGGGLVGAFGATRVDRNGADGEGLAIDLGFAVLGEPDDGRLGVDKVVGHDAIGVGFGGADHLAGSRGGDRQAREGSGLDFDGLAAGEGDFDTGIEVRENLEGLGTVLGNGGRASRGGGIGHVADGGLEGLVVFGDDGRLHAVGVGEADAVDGVVLGRTHRDRVRARARVILVERDAVDVVARGAVLDVEDDQQVDRRVGGGRDAKELVPGRAVEGVEGGGRVAVARDLRDREAGAGRANAVARGQLLHRTLGDLEAGLETDHLVGGGRGLGLDALHARGKPFDISEIGCLDIEPLGLALRVEAAGERGIARGESPVDGLVPGQAREGRGRAGDRDRDAGRVGGAVHRRAVGRDGGLDLGAGRAAREDGRGDRRPGEGEFGGDNLVGGVGGGVGLVAGDGRNLRIPAGERVGVLVVIGLRRIGWLHDVRRRRPVVVLRRRDFRVVFVLERDRVLAGGGGVRRRVGGIARNLRNRRRPAAEHKGLRGRGALRRIGGLHDVRRRRPVVVLRRGDFRVVVILELDRVLAERLGILRVVVGDGDDRLVGEGHDLVGAGGVGPAGELVGVLGGGLPGHRGAGVGGSGVGNDAGGPAGGGGAFVEEGNEELARRGGLGGAGHLGDGALAGEGDGRDLVERRGERDG